MVMKIVHVIQVTESRNNQTPMWKLLPGDKMSVAPSEKCEFEFVADWKRQLEHVVRFDTHSYTGSHIETPFRV